MADRSRSPPPVSDRGRPEAAHLNGNAAAPKPKAPSAEDVAAAHALREAYAPPAQSKFRVASVVRFLRRDGSEGCICAVNAEPHDGNIRGAICAERAALCRFQQEEAGGGAQITRVVCVTDNREAIFPGPCCREFLTAACGPETEILASGTADPTSWEACPLSELLPVPSVYRRRDRPAMAATGASLAKRVRAPADAGLAAAYAAAVARARTQKAQAAVFPIVFAAAVRFADGRVYSTQELKGIEYGCTVDAVSLLIPEMIRVREEQGPAPVCLVQADDLGIAHAPFASARSLLIEHGFGDVVFAGHKDDGEWSETLSATASLPRAGFTLLF